MAFEQPKLHEIVERAVNHNWSIPEFQRGFVWKSTQVRDLAQSLYLDFPIGSILLWDSRGPSETRTATDAQTPSLWVVDGQQRSTALCVLFGRKPYWWTDATKWNALVARYDIRFDIEALEEPLFVVASAPIRRTKNRRYIRLSELLNLDLNREEDSAKLRQIAQEVKADQLCPGRDEMEIYARLSRVTKMRDKLMVAETVQHDLEDVVEIFARLNSRGTRVKEADIYLGIVAARSPGFVREEFLPFLTRQAERGFDIDPNLLFRVVTAVGCGMVRFKQVEDGFWNQDRILPAWKKGVSAWERLLRRLNSFGVLSNGILPTQAALVVMAAMVDQFGDPIDFPVAFHWMLQASRHGRYSGSGTTALDEDLRDVTQSNNMVEACNRLLRRFRWEEPMTAEDFMRDYTDIRFGRLIYYLMVFDRHARDWDEHSHRLGFEGSQSYEGFQPQWHHVFPVQYLSEFDIPDDQINALANMAVIGPNINIRISKKSPLDYVERYKIDDDRLAEQFIDSAIVQVSGRDHLAWVEARGQVLADAANEYLARLSSAT